MRPEATSVRGLKLVSLQSLPRCCEKLRVTVAMRLAETLSERQILWETSFGERDLVREKRFGIERLLMKRRKYCVMSTWVEIEF